MPHDGTDLACPIPTPGMMWGLGWGFDAGNTFLKAVIKVSYRGQCLLMSNAP